MSERQLAVNMGQLRLSKEPSEELVALGLGSCVAVCMYDPKLRLAGMGHIVLPNSDTGITRGEAGKFANEGVPTLLKGMREAGALATRLRVAIFGGANVLTCAENQPGFDIGRRNVTAVREALANLGLNIGVEEVGGTSSRTVTLRVRDGVILLRSLKEGSHIYTCLGETR